MKRAEYNCDAVRTTENLYELLHIYSIIQETKRKNDYREIRAVMLDLLLAIGMGDSNANGVLLIGLTKGLLHDSCLENMSKIYTLKNPN